ncbi:tRNA dihydrouridine synthase A [Vibrio maritimus]|uniref:tRNA dihydrouridine synthase A n=1 Tax=Vibrio maritimus TaxID=990268 RepID=A0A090TD53_9VIBR|nr:tRNA dihydrouridine synthase A [Vibrio maritimus]
MAKWLEPKENREIPPLDYPRAYQIKKDFPHLNVAVNGGVKTLEESLEHLQHLDGVMIGREAYQNPYILAQVDQLIFGLDTPVKKRKQVVEEMYPYIERQLSNGSYLGHISRHMIGLFQAMPGARQWRRYISENAHKKGAGIEVLETALAKIPSELDV